MTKPIKDLVPDLQQVLDHTMRETVISFHSDLSGEISPIDTGDFRAAWMADGDASASSLKLDYKHKYTIENNLPYAERLCFGNWAVSRPKTWFPDYFNSKGQAIVDAAVRKAEGTL